MHDPRRLPSPIQFEEHRAGRGPEDAEQAMLKGGGVFDDERIELAPLTTGADWRHWFDTVLVGHFVSGYVPAC